MIDKISFKLITENTKIEGNILEIEAYINDKRMFDHNYTSLDINELLKSIKSLDGNYGFFTCTCGEAGCAGFYDGVMIKHNTEENKLDCVFLDYEEYLDFYEEIDFLKEYTFERDQYIRAVINIVDEFKQKYNYYKEENIEFTITPSQNEYYADKLVY